MKLDASAHFATLCIHAGQEPDPSTGAIITPIYQTSTYVQDALGEHKGYEYARTQNPTRAALEANVAALEAGRAGFAFASGMAAIGAVDLAPRSRATTSWSPTTRTAARSGCSSACCGATTCTSPTSTPAGSIWSTAAFTPKTRMLFLETPTNPVLGLTDLAGGLGAGARHGASVVVDNTFASPALQRPIELGADLVLHSTTKYLNGHSDSVGGIVVAQHDADIEWLKFYQNAAGAILSPFDSWLVLRGTKTLAIRMAQHNINGLALARVSRRRIRRCSRCSTPACPRIRSTRWPRGRWRASAGCCRSSWDRSSTRGASSTACACWRWPKASAASRA